MGVRAPPQLTPFLEDIIEVTHVSTDTHREIRHNKNKADTEAWMPTECNTEDSDSLQYEVSLTGQGKVSQRC